MFISDNYLSHGKELLTHFKRHFHRVMLAVYDFRKLILKL